MAGENVRPLICLGEALVDLICPESVDEPIEARNYDVRFGGALANVAVAASRAGGTVALAGGSGDDEWGRFLREELQREGVDLEFHSVIEGLSTPFAFATLDHRREPSFRIHGDGIEAAVGTLAGREQELVTAAGAVVLGSNTLVGELGRSVSANVVDAAAGAGVPILFDPNLRPGRWSDLERARRICLETISAASVLKCNLAEARWLVGSAEESGELAAALAERGPRLVVVTAGTDPVVVRGACETEVDPPEVEMVSPLGAGDVFMGTMAAGLMADGWGLNEVEGALQSATAAGAEACTRLGAFA